MKHIRFFMILCLLLAVACCFVACDTSSSPDGDDADGGDGTGCTHEYTDTVVAPTCTTGGYTTHTCSKCGDVKKDTEVAAKGHSYTDKVTGDCQHTYKDTVVALLGHAWNFANATNTSCGCGTCTTTYSWTAQSGFELDFISCTVDGVSGYEIAGFTGTLPNTLKLPAVHEGKPVLAIGDFALTEHGTSSLDAEHLMTLVVPDTVVEIGDAAFADSPNLENVTLPNTLKRIGSNPFSLTKFEKNACKESNQRFTYQVRPFIINNRYFITGFLNTDETEYKIPEGITVIAKEAFENMSRMVTVTIPSTVRYVGYDAFNGCSGLKTINICKGVVEFATRVYYVVNNHGVLQTVNFEGTQTEWQAIKNNAAFATRYMKYGQKIG